MKCIQKTVFRANESLFVRCKRGTSKLSCGKVLLNGCGDKAKSHMGSKSRCRVLMLSFLHQQQSQRKERGVEKGKSGGAHSRHFKHFGIIQTHSDSGPIIRDSDTFTFRCWLEHEEECRESLQSLKFVITNSQSFFLAYLRKGRNLW